MQVVTGGAFNGKKNWVLNQFPSEKRYYSWFNLYETTEFGWLPVFDLKHRVVVIEGVEQGLRKKLEGSEKETASFFFNEYLQPLLSWESAHTDRKVIVIGTDISKGVVPLEKETRIWRDETGRLYQKLFKHADDVYRIWFGIAQLLKTGRS